MAEDRCGMCAAVLHKQQQNQQAGLARPGRGFRRGWVGAVAAVVTGALTMGMGPMGPHGDGLSPDITAIMHKPAYKHAQWGLLEIDNRTGRVIHSQHPDQFFIPGSTAKLVSVSGAWNALGGDHRFTTPVQAVGRRNGSVLNGNLVLVGKGDLTMGGRTAPDGAVSYTTIDHTYANDVPGAILTPENPLAGLNRIARQVRRSGITEVRGNLAVDTRLFTSYAELDPTPPR